MTSRVSPEITALDDAKSTTPYSDPLEEPLESEEDKKAPTIVDVPFMEKVALLEELSQVLVVVPVIEPSVSVCRVD